MLITKIVSSINALLAGEILSLSELTVHLDATIDLINARLNTTFPTFTDLPEYSIEYTALPDKYIRTVVVNGAAYNYFTTDEEGAMVAPEYKEKFLQNLFYMERDYLMLVPLEYLADDAQGTFDFDAEDGEPRGISVTGDYGTYSGSSTHRQNQIAELYTALAAVQESLTAALTRFTALAAVQESLTAALTRFTPLETAVHNHANKNLLDTYTLTNTALNDALTKLSAIEEEANHTVVENSLTSTSTTNALSAASAGTLVNRMDSMGGINLLKNSNLLYDTSEWYLSAGWVRDTATQLDKSVSFKCSRTGLTSDSNASTYPTAANMVPYVSGTPYTFSVYIKTDDIAAIDGVLSLSLVGYTAADGLVETIASTVVTLTENNKFTKFTVTGSTMNASVANMRPTVQMTRNGTVWVASPQLERGYAATDWAPNAQDLYSNSCNLLVGTYAARPTSVPQKTLYLASDKAAGNVNRLTISTNGTVWHQV